MKSPARRFTLIMLAMSALFVGGPVLFNYLVDPYDRFGNNRLGIYIMAEREMKASEVERYTHNALLIGNSRIASIPVSQMKEFRFFNASVAAASAEEIYFFLEHHAAIAVILQATRQNGDLPGDIIQTHRLAAVMAAARERKQPAGDLLAAKRLVPNDALSIHRAG